MSSIKPMVGRILLFTPSVTDGLFTHTRAEPMAAVVASVQGDRVVTVAVFDACGSAHRRAKVLLVQPGDERPGLEVSFCEWMPYQVGQAAKTEDVAAKLKAEVAEAFAEMERQVQCLRTEIADLKKSLGEVSKVPSNPGCQP